METALRRKGQLVRVIEDCLNGRRTAFDDPYKPGRNGLVGLETRIEINSPLDVVILMLGTNDFQSMHLHNAWHSAQGMAALVDAVRNAPMEPGMPVPRILIVAPPAIQEPKGAIAPKFEGAQKKCVGLAAAYAEVARNRG
jgi:lysophospholipase L1-like esterase